MTIKKRNSVHTYIQAAEAFPCYVFRHIERTCIYLYYINSTPVHTAKLVAKILLNRKLKTCMEEISLDVEDKRKYRWNWDTENSIIKNFEYR